MSLQEQNRMLQILHKNGGSRKNIEIIMNDLKESKVFNDSEDEDDLMEILFLEKQANWLFSSVDNSEKMDAIKTIKKNQEDYEMMKRRSQYIIDQEKRIQKIQEDLIKRGLVPPNKLKYTQEIIGSSVITRYGRSPLHEAISMRNICLVKKYIKRGDYLEEIDNNGHTAMEMALYEDYKEALALFKTYGS